ncbi:hypothetical protein L1F30_15615 [Simiduia sp. 21SJ11W-1]|uniref:hypothetical protein n=1 Tax=Simiduia sp. 21SJ11W-1 TaxID=2909669 RepID=UPI0020A17947|nr:hypothetical protein [Simiduia sp. 21SJ11W-1]UTA47569.1 hypothetical protein L1F30_15615 [Simiduia sp. 21SJ11W-1]
MDKPRIKVDFNELLDKDLVFLSKTDTREDSDGNVVILSEGLHVSLYEHNEYSDGEIEYLYAEGVVVPNVIQENPIAIWCCKINEKGITVVNE